MKPLIEQIQDLVDDDVKAEILLSQADLIINQENQNKMIAELADDEVKAEILLNQCNVLINQENQDAVLAEILLNQMGV